MKYWTEDGKEGVKELIKMYGKISNEWREDGVHGKDNGKERERKKKDGNRMREKRKRTIKKEVVRS